LAAVRLYRPMTAVWERAAEPPVAMVLRAPNGVSARDAATDDA